MIPTQARRCSSRCRLLYEIRMVGLLLCLSGYAIGQQLTTQNPYKIKAAFLRNFAHYVTWPANSFSADTSPWSIGILGKDPFGDLLEKTFEGRQEQGRSFVVHRVDTVDKLPPCHIVFIADKNPVKRREALARLRGQPVLTVGNVPDFLQEGGIIQFRVRERVEISINLDQARSVSLEIQTKMLEVSREVLKDGKMHKLR